MTLPKKLKEARKFLGFNQVQMAKALGLGHRSWQGYENDNDRGSMPGGKVFEALAALGFNVNWFFDDNDNIPMMIEDYLRDAQSEMVKDMVGGDKEVARSRQQRTKNIGKELSNNKVAAQIEPGTERRKQHLLHKPPGFSDIPTITGDENNAFYIKLWISELTDIELMRIITSIDHEAGVENYGPASFMATVNQNHKLQSKSLKELFFAWVDSLKDMDITLALVALGYVDLGPRSFSDFMQFLKSTKAQTAERENSS